MPQLIRAWARNHNILLVLALTASHVAASRARAQSPAAPQSGGAAPVAQSGQQPTVGAGADAPAGLPRAEIEKLVAPIALYPDVLISQILPAATFPTEIVQAARWCKAHPDLKGLDDQKWDLSVLSICRYPPVLSKMDEDLDWTNALGAAFLSQSNDVMAAIQTLRQKAEQNGALKTTPQQTVVNEGTTIIIAPAEKQVIYVPQYDPQVVYVDNSSSNTAAVVAAGAIGFGVGFALGAWLDNDCDWHGGCVVGCRPGYWHGWGWHGAAHWDNDWAAFRGPRRGAIVGENGGAYVGPRGAAVWGENGHGAAWRRPNTYGGPVYGGRYAGYNNVVGNRNVVSGNTVNVNRTNVNIDRGDRAYVQGGDRTNIGGDRTNVVGGERTSVGGDRTNVGGDRTNVGGGDRTDIGAGDRTRPAGGDRPNVGGGDGAGVGSGSRPPGGGQNPSAFGPRPSTGDVNAARDRGQQSLQGSRPSGDKPTQRPASEAQRPSTPQQRPQTQPQRQPSSFGASQRSGADVQRYSNRGSSSRSGGASRGGGGGGRRR